MGARPGDGLALGDAEAPSVDAGVGLLQQFASLISERAYRRAMSQADAAEVAGAPAVATLARNQPALWAFKQPAVDAGGRLRPRIGSGYLPS